MPTPPPRPRRRVTLSGGVQEAEDVIGAIVAADAPEEEQEDK
jgi:hypothetical protein